VGPTSFLASGVAELSGFTEINGQPIRIRPDYLKDDVIVDLKTTHDARVEAFSRSVFTFGYDVQAALYVDAAKAIDGKQRRFIWIVVEKEAPYGVCIYECSQEILARGRKLYNQAIDTYAQCAAFDVWPTYSTAVQTFNIPRYMEIL
jgi:exodeoxyribonuclease VIII